MDEPSSRQLIFPIPCGATDTAWCHRYCVVPPIPCGATATVWCHRYRVVPPIPCGATDTSISIPFDLALNDTQHQHLRITFLQRLTAVRSHTPNASANHPSVSARDCCDCRPSPLQDPTPSPLQDPTPW